MSDIRFILDVAAASLGIFRPFMLNYSITSRCNSRCLTCNIWKTKARTELTLGEITEFARANRFFRWVRLMGGEPFMRDDFVDIVKTLDENLEGLVSISTPTNSLLKDKIISDVSALLSFFKKRFIVTVSLDGYREIHDHIRGRPGNFDLAVETYSRLKEFEKKNGNFRVFFGYTLSPNNLGELERTLKEVGEIIPGFDANDLHVNLFHVSEVYYGDNREKIVDETFAPGASREIRSFIEKRAFRPNPVWLLEKRYLELCEAYLSTGRTPIPCTVYNTSVYVDSAGEVFPCAGFNFRLGVLRDSGYDVMKILKRPSAKEARELIRKGQCPQCWTPCHAHQTILTQPRHWF